MTNRKAVRDAQLQSCDVAIIGAGFSGSMLAIHLVSAQDAPAVALIERNRSFGPGIAYGAAAPEHLLNVPAGKMGAFPDKPDDFLRWVHANPEIAESFNVKAAVATDFLPRGLYGRYLKSLVAEAKIRTGGLE